MNELELFAILSVINVTFLILIFAALYAIYNKLKIDLNCIETDLSILCKDQDTIRFTIYNIKRISEDIKFNIKKIRKLQYNNGTKKSKKCDKGQ